MGRPCNRRRCSRLCSGETAALRGRGGDPMPEPAPSPKHPGGSPTSSDYEHVYLAEYDRIVRTVYLVVRAAGRAEDLTQEAFVRLYLQWGKVGRYERPGAWVRRVAIRL